jgi:hypothetical protein
LQENLQEKNTQCLFEYLPIKVQLAHKTLTVGGANTPSRWYEAEGVIRISSSSATKTVQVITMVIQYRLSLLG